MNLTPDLSLAPYRETIRNHYLADEAQTIHTLMDNAALTVDDRTAISANAAQLVRKVRTESSPSMMEKFLAEYGLTTKEGVALMCLAEALLRVPDSTTIDALIEDKVASGNWRSHLGKADSSLVNSSTWALMLTGKLIAPEEDEKKGVTQTLRSLVKRMGEPVVRTAVGQAMKELGRQFVLGRTIEEATKRASKLESQGYTYSYDMLGEAARTDADAIRYHQAYSLAIRELSAACTHNDIRKNPGISVKLSALHARYEFGQRDRVMEELVERTRTLALQAKQANMGFNIDAEEADRLDLSLDIIEAVLSDPALAGWDGFGIVVQAFGPRASFVLDWLYALSTRLDRKIMVRLVKGAYWDAEIKRSQVLGLNGFPVYTRKVNSDVSYMCCAEKLLGMTDRIYPQFATHNAHSVSAILHMARMMDASQFEFQRLHGMGELLYQTLGRMAEHFKVAMPLAILLNSPYPNLATATYHPDAGIVYVYAGALTDKEWTTSVFDGALAHEFGHIVNADDKKSDEENRKRITERRERNQKRLDMYVLAVQFYQFLENYGVQYKNIDAYQVEDKVLKALDNVFVQVKNLDTNSVKEAIQGVKAALTQGTFQPRDKDGNVLATLSYNPTDALSGQLEKLKGVVAVKLPTALVAVKKDMNAFLKMLQTYRHGPQVSYTQDGQSVMLEQFDEQEFKDFAKSMQRELLTLTEKKGRLSFASDLEEAQENVNKFLSDKVKKERDSYAKVKDIHKAFGHAADVLQEVSFAPVPRGNISQSEEYAAFKDFVQNLHSDKQDANTENVTVENPVLEENKDNHDMTVIQVIQEN